MTKVQFCHESENCCAASTVFFKVAASPMGRFETETLALAENRAAPEPIAHAAE